MKIHPHLICLLPLLACVLASCNMAPFGEDLDSNSVSTYVGKANVIGLEMKLGNQAIGAAITHRKLSSTVSVPPEIQEVEIVYPDK